MENIINKLASFRKTESKQSIIEDYVSLKDVKEYFYHLPNDFENMEHVSLTDYCVVCGDFITGIKYTTDENKNYYMFISANSFYVPPQQIAIGKAENGIIYLMQESISSSATVNFVSFSETSINKKTQGFIPKSYRDSISFIGESIDNLSNESLKCLENRLEACETFGELIDNYKRKKVPTKERS